MRTITTIALMVVRLFGIILLVLGALFWTGNALQLVATHMLLGVLFVLALWTLSGIGAATRQAGGLVASGFIWGIVVLAFGMMQQSLMPGSAHWVIRVLHLLIGLIAMGLGERLGAGIKRSQATTV